MGLFLKPRLPKYAAQILTTQPQHSTLAFFYETDIGSSFTGHRATRVVAQAKVLRMFQVILLPSLLYTWMAGCFSLGSTLRVMIPSHCP